jgi:hypothetical protein
MYAEVSSLSTLPLTIAMRYESASVAVWVVLGTFDGGDDEVGVSDGPPEGTGDTEGDGVLVGQTDGAPETEGANEADGVRLGSEEMVGPSEGFKDGGKDAEGVSVGTWEGAGETEGNTLGTSVGTTIRDGAGLVGNTGEGAYDLFIVCSFRAPLIG